MASPEEHPEVAPLAPEDKDIARAYADIAMGYNKRLPELEKKVQQLLERHETTSAIAISSQGLVSQLALRVEDIALRVRAPRTYSSGSMAAVSAAPPAPPLEIKTGASKTGSHATIEFEELDRLKAKWAEKEAEERGAKEEAARLQAELLYEQAMSKANREKWGFILAVAVALCGAVWWAVVHVHLTTQ